jgi:hypothetical protein
MDGGPGLTEVLVTGFRRVLAIAVGGKARGCGDGTGNPVLTRLHIRHNNSPKS